ncbi:unnamed protein product [Lathyrus oleraceus]
MIIDIEVTAPSDESSMNSDGGFTRGLVDQSMLTKYVGHMELRLWNGDDRPTLKVTLYGSKMKDFYKISMPEKVSRIVRDFELLDFAHCSITMLDAPLLIVFIERWHKEISSFHLLFEEISITLDDVSSLFHIPIDSRFWVAPVLSMSLACLTVARDLGVFEETM